jgi:DNA polymerase-3 subunit epsilon
LEPSQGHRIVEIGCVEIVNRRLTGATLHSYFNPGRDSDEGALKVHGLTKEFLSDKPRFGEWFERLVRFVDGAEVLIHNAPFDEAFLDAEFDLIGKPKFRGHCLDLTDTLLLARQTYPGKRNSLDALCDRLGVSNAHRTLHGALLDAQLLAEVYLAMTRGQESFVIDMQMPNRMQQLIEDDWPPSELIVLPADDDERALHGAAIDAIARESKGRAVWTSGL